MGVPFFYQINFSLFAYNNQDDLKQHQYKKDFKDPNPILARNMAFEEFEEYMSWLKSINRVKKTEDNYLLIQPDYISKEIQEKRIEYEKSEQQDDSLYTGTKKLCEWLDLYEKYEEELRLDIILEEEAMEAAGEDESQFTIHKVSSYEYDPDDLLCGGLLVELSLYDYYKFNTQNKRIKVEYYGTDYNEAGDDPTAGKYEILEIPRRWISDKPVDDTKEELTHEDIIQKGEGKYIEFKPTLLYNFKTGEPGISVKYKVAQAIAAFLNSEGGFLYVGIKDDKSIQGLDFDYSILEGNKQDKLKLEFDQLIRYFFPAFVSTYILTSIIQIQGKDVYVIRVHSSQKPVILRNKTGDKINKEFYIRQEASSIKIDDIEEIIEYIFNHKNFNKNRNA